MSLSPRADERRRISDEEWFARNGHYAGVGGVPIGDEEHSEFVALVAPLERAAGRPLSGPGRSKCMRAFKENPDAFARLTAAALERGRVNPLGLLIRMVSDRDHRLELA